MKRGLTLLVGLLMSMQAMANDKLELLLDWFVNPDHAPIIVAQQRGFFEEQGLDVDIVEPADPAMPPKLVAAGKADIAIGYGPQLHIQVDQGLPLMRLGTLIATPLDCLIVLKDGPVKSIADLKGRRIGYSVAGYENALIGTMLEKYGLSMDDVELINVNWSLSPSLIAGRVDAIIGGYRNFELNQMAIEGHPGRAFYVEEEGLPAYDELIYLINKEKAQDPRMPRFMAAIEKATIYMQNHPNDAWQAFISYKPDELSTELNKRAWADTLPRFALRPLALDAARYQKMGAFMQARGLIQSNPAVSTYTVAQ